MDQQVKSKILKRMNYDERTSDIFEILIIDEIVKSHEQLRFAENLDVLRKIQGRLEFAIELKFLLDEAKKKSIYKEEKE